MKAVEKAYPQNSKNRVATSTGEAFRFVREMKPGDRVVTYELGSRGYLAGDITRDYEYRAALVEIGPQHRAVHWRGTVARDALTVSTCNSLGAIVTLFQLPEDAADDIGNHLSTRVVAAEMVPARVAAGEDKQTEFLLKDIQAKAFEFIKDKISSLDADELQELVAGAAAHPARGTIPGPG